MKTRFLLLFAVLMFGLAPSQLSAQSKGRTAVLNTVGAQGGALAYNTLCLIGAMHDGYLQDVWEKDVVVQIMDEQISLMGVMINQYDSLLATAYLETEDSLVVVDFRECCLLLKTEAESLKDYVNNETDENHEQYLDAREAAWKKIALLLGLEEHTSWGTATRKQAGTH